MLSPYPGPQTRKPLWIGAPFLWAYSPFTCLRGSCVSLKKFHNIRELRPTSQGEISESDHPRAPDPLLSTRFNQALHFNPNLARKPDFLALTARSVARPSGKEEPRRPEPRPPRTEIHTLLPFLPGTLLVILWKRVRKPSSL